MPREAFAGQLDNLVDQLGVGDTTLQEADAAWASKDLANRRKLLRAEIMS